MKAAAVLFLAAAAQAEPERLSLTSDQAVARALEVSPRLVELRASERAAEAALGEADAEGKPTVDVSASYTRYSDIPEIAFPGPAGGEEVLFPNIPNNYRARVGASYSLYTGGRVEGLVDAARGAEVSAEAALEVGRLDLALEVRRAYWRLVTSRDRVWVLEENVAAFEAHLADARNRVRFGLAAANEVLAVEVERDRAEVGRLRAETSARLAEADLRRLLGLGPDVPIDPAEALSRQPPDVPEREDLETLVELAYERRSELAALDAEAEAAEARARVERSASLPQVSVSAAYLYANPNPRFLPPRVEWNDNWEVGVSVGMRLFDGGKASAAEARALSRAHALRARVDDLRERIRLQVLSGVLEIENADAEVALSEQAVASARENRRVAADRYREGLLLSSELLDAEVALLRAELELAESLATRRLAEAALDRAVGR